MENPKIRVIISVFEKENKKHYVEYQIEENDPTMKDVALLVFKMKQIEQEFIDRAMDDDNEEGYEIIKKKQ